MLEVANGGEPIDPEQAATLAEPFRRLYRSVDGFGLGLSIVRSVAEAHGGSMRLTAPDDGGLRVLVTLPGPRSEPRVAGFGTCPDRRAASADGELTSMLKPDQRDPRRHRAQSMDCAYCLR